MAVRTKAAPPTSKPKTSKSNSLAEPKIDSTAYVHSFSNVMGDVKVQAKVLIAPGSSIRADQGTPFYIGEAASIQEGVVIHGLKKGLVVGDDSQEYSVWIGKQTCIAHMALIHGPAYIGDDCFIGFRSTVFNARVGHGCVIMMHALVQDVEIPPGKYVPSGAIVTNQQQADRLPNVQESDRALARYVMQMQGELQGGYAQAATPSSSESKRVPLHRSKNTPKKTDYKNSVTSMSSSSQIREQVRSLLLQGCTIGAEHANSRRFKTKSWLSCGSINGRKEDQVIQELETYLREYEGEYVRLIGIDPQAKRRVAEVIVQRPGDVPLTSSGTNQTASYSYSRSSNANSGVKSSSNGSLNTDLASQVRSLLQQGYAIGTEYASERRFKTKSWQTGTAIASQRESDVLKLLQETLKEHEGEYVRVIGIDPQAKRRVSEIIVQRPGEKVSIGANGSTSYRTGTKIKPTASSNGLDADMIAQVRSLLAQGYTIGTEHADKRRFKTKSWQSCSPINSTRETDVIAALEDCLAEHQGEYVRLLGIDSQAKRRVLEAIIQRPGENSQTNSRNGAPANTVSYSYSNGNSSTVSSSGLDAETITQVRSLLAQGYTIGSEHADKRRFKTKSWQSCSPINSSREGDVIAALEACLAEHQGEYVRLLGIDPHAKRRILETIIQRP